MSVSVTVSLSASGFLHKDAILARHRRPEPDLAFPAVPRAVDQSSSGPPPVDAPGRGPDADHEAAAVSAPLTDRPAHTAQVGQTPPRGPLAATRRPVRGAHRRPGGGAGGRVLAVSVAAGALLTAATSSAHAATDEHTLDRRQADPDESTGAAPSQAPQVLQVSQVPTLADFADQLERARVREERRAAREAEARRPKTLMPVSGTLTSNFGPRWGTTHYGLDIANTIGTPIVSVTDGTVLEAGPASGFGLWVRILQDDGTIGVFGHIDQALVSAGQRVRAGEQIATVGNRGQSTGPHLHYEVWASDGRKADPMAWLNARGVPVVPDARA